MFQKDSYVKIVDTLGNYRFGYISESKERGFILTIDLHEEGLSKIEYDTLHGYDQPNFKLSLTETEKRLIVLLAALKSTKEIARDLDISPITVRAHIRSLKLKLQLETREQLIAYSQGIREKIKNGSS
jgi:DNA-binding CsgD family transcriptional regulator